MKTYKMRSFVREGTWDGVGTVEGLIGFQMRRREDGFDITGPDIIKSYFSDSKIAQWPKEVVAETWGDLFKKATGYDSLGKPEILAFFYYEDKMAEALKPCPNKYWRTYSTPAMKRGMIVHRAAFQEAWPETNALGGMRSPDYKTLEASTLAQLVGETLKDRPLFEQEVINAFLNQDRRFINETKEAFDRLGDSVRLQKLLDAEYRHTERLKDEIDRQRNTNEILLGETRRLRRDFKRLEEELTDSSGSAVADAPEYKHGPVISCQDQYDPEG